MVEYQSVLCWQTMTCICTMQLVFLASTVFPLTLIRATSCKKGDSLKHRGKGSENCKRPYAVANRLFQEETVQVFVDLLGVIQLQNKLTVESFTNKVLHDGRFLSFSHFSSEVVVAIVIFAPRSHEIRYTAKGTQARMEK